jgi:hypothetical protein
MARWSKFGSTQYEEGIARIRSSSMTESMWMIEEQCLNFPSVKRIEWLEADRSTGASGQ